jgi:hypothetical protein
MAKTTHRASLMSDDGSQYLLPMFAVLRYRYAIQAVRPTHHWWQCPRGLAWFQVLMVWSLVKPSACAEPLSRIGDYLRAARGPGLLLQIKKRTAFPHEHSPTRSPPDPLFHRRRLTYRISSESYPGNQGCVVSCHGAGRFANSIPPIFETPLHVTAVCMYRYINQL